MFLNCVQMDDEYLKDFTVIITMCCTLQFPSHRPVISVISTLSEHNITIKHVLEEKYNKLKECSWWLNVV